MRIIGLTGTLGAGKGTVVDYLKEKGCRHYSARAFIVAEIERQGLPVNRDTMVRVANELRREHSPSFIIEALYDQAVTDQAGDCVIESIRTEGEIKALRQKDHFQLLAVDAEQALRYERIKKRGSETDAISLAKFQADEAREMSSGDPNEQNLIGCLKLADQVISNNGTISQLRAAIDRFLTTTPA